MPWVIRRHHRAFAGAVDQRPAGSGFQVVVVGAQRVELVEPGVPGLRPGFAVVVLGSGPPAPRHGAAGTGPGQGDLLSGRWPAAEVSHIEDIHPAGDDQVQTPNGRGAVRRPTPAPGRRRGSRTARHRPPGRGAGPAHRPAAAPDTADSAAPTAAAAPAGQRRARRHADHTHHRRRQLTGPPTRSHRRRRRVRPVGRRVPSARRRRRPPPARCGRLGGRW